MSYMVEISKVLPLEISIIFSSSISIFTGKKNHVHKPICGDFRGKIRNQALALHNFSKTDLPTLPHERIFSINFRKHKRTTSEWQQKCVPRKVPIKEVRFAPRIDIISHKLAPVASSEVCVSCLFSPQKHSRVTSKW